MMLAIAMSAGIGGLHALTPGHGKTIMAAYLIGTRGTARHAVMLGLTVAVSHTIGVLALGAITLYASSFLTPESTYPYLGLGAGVLVTGIGVSMLYRRLRSRSAHHEHDHGHVHGAGEDHHHHRAAPAAVPPLWASAPLPLCWAESWRFSSSIWACMAASWAWSSSREAAAIGCSFSATEIVGSTFCRTLTSAPSGG